MIKRLLLSALLLFVFSQAWAQPANDTCANAIALTVGTGICNSVSYDNTTATAEPGDPIPSCWVPSSISHTMWFTFVPDSSRVHISTNFNYALSNTQLAVFSGVCSSLTLIACQEDIFTFGSYLHTDLIVEGLVAGNTYYIMVDGNGSAAGTFGVCVENIGPPSAPLVSEDCFTATYLCDTSQIYVASNIHSDGSVDEQPYCWPPTLLTDPGAYWYQFTALTTGTLAFDIYPNDANTDYNWAVFDVSFGCYPLSPMDCNSATTLAVVTGLGCGSAACSPTPLNVISGATYAILVSRRTANATGFTLNFTTTTAMFGGVPMPNFTFDDSLCAGQQVAFTNTSSTQNQNLSFVWNFGDGFTSTAANPTHSYATPGTYTITLISTCGSSSNVRTRNINIMPGLTATVTPASHTMCNGDSVTLIGSATFNPALLVPQTFSNTTPMPIPDAPSPGIQSDITVSGIVPNLFFANPVISVCLNITHPFVGNLSLELKAPNGNSIFLYFTSGGSGDNFTGTCFVPTGAPSILTGVAPFTGNFTPDGAFSPFLDTSPIDGVWSLIVTDLTGGNIGTLLDWSITFNTQNYLTYSWTPSTGLSDPSSDTTVATPNVSTDYTFMATDATGCPGSATSQVNVTNTPQSTFTINSTTLCVDEVATVTYTGTASSGATFTWSLGADSIISGTGTPSDPYFISWASAGTDSITLTVQDSSCTSVTTVIYVTINPFPTVTAGSDITVCEGSPINLTATSSSPTATFSWLGPGFSSLQQNPVIPAATLSMEGMYQVVATDSGCPSLQDVLFVDVVPIPVANATSNSPVCDEGTITFTGTPVLGGTYSWTGPNSFSATVASPTITPASPASAGTYSLIVTAQGCSSAPFDVVIVVDPLPAPPVAGSNSPICETATLDLFTDTVAGSSYSWTGPNGFSDSNQNTSLAVGPGDSGDYIVTRTDSVTGCTSHSDTVTVQVDQLLFATLPESVLHTCTLHTQIAANDPSPATGTWSLVSGTGDPIPPNSFVALATNVDTGTSVFQWLVINGTCHDSTQLTVIYDGIDTCGTLEANELITPNNDALNEELVFTGLFQHPQNKLVIFNRWGSEVYSRNNYKNDWKGRTEADTAGDELPDGTYYYVLTIPGMEAIKGFVEIRK